jgi:hypothetical protein
MPIILTISEGALEVVLMGENVVAAVELLKICS